MAEEVKFGQVFVRAEKKQRGIILYPPNKDGGAVTVRFLGTQQQIYQVWNRYSRTYTCFENKVEGASPRIVSFVIDRADEKVKAFICSRSVYQQLGESDSEHDFRIQRRGSGISTRYDVASLGETVVSEDLLKRVEMTSETYPLTSIFINKVKWHLLEEEEQPITNRFDILDL